jgi:hypothetical protein
MKNKVLLLIVLGATALIALGLYCGLKSLVGSIYDSRSCQQYNIDNIELRTGMDVPKVASVDCSCKDNVKTSSFVLDTSKFDLDDYIRKSKLIRLSDNTYAANGENEDTRWRATLDPRTVELSFRLEYKD